LLTLRGPKGPRRGPGLGELGIITDGSVLIENGTIIEIGPARRVENLAKARNAREIVARGRVVLPGFVDSHTHLIYPPRGVRGATAESAARALRTSTVRLLGARSLPYLEAMARHGTTTVEIKTGCGPDEAAELKALRVAALLQEGPIDVVPTYLMRVPNGASDTDAEEIVADLAPRILRRSMAAFADLYWDGNASRQDIYARFLADAAASGLGLKVHAAGPGCAPAVALAVGHRAASIDHLEHLSPDLAPLLANGRTVATLIPSAALNPWGLIAPARALIDNGAAVALASDFNPHHTPSLNMQTVIALACLQMRLTSAEAIAAVTINGAYALDRADRIGSLELGKAADLLVLNIDDYREISRYLGVNLVHVTIKGGATIYEEGAVLRAG
jgi:imidazolonepropionase